MLPLGDIRSVRAKPRQRSPLLFMFTHPAGIWMRACSVFGQHGDMLVNATFNSRTTARPLVIGGAK